MGTSISRSAGDGKASGWRRRVEPGKAEDPRSLGDQGGHGAEGRESLVLHGVGRAVVMERCTGKSPAHRQVAGTRCRERRVATGLSVRVKTVMSTHGEVAGCPAAPCSLRCAFA